MGDSGHGTSCGQGFAEAAVGYDATGSAVLSRASGVRLAGVLLAQTEAAGPAWPLDRDDDADPAPLGITESVDHEATEAAPGSPAPSGPRKIIHVDMDAFYASVEQRDNPDLRGRPVAVGGGERGVVAAASYEARRFGVRSAMPSGQAQRRCPELIFVKPRFDVYKAVSRQIREIFARYTPLIEPLSLDEAYLDVTENIPNIPSATRIAEEIRAAIHVETGLTASAGVSYNKMLAKIASDQRKPDGLFVIRPEDGPGFVETLEVGRFHGIGPVTAARMNALGIITGADLKRLSLQELSGHFGKSGPWYYGLARAEDRRRVQPNRPRKSIGSETTFPRDLLTHAEAIAGLRPCIDDVWNSVERFGTYGRTVTLKLRYGDFIQLTRSHSDLTAISSREIFEGHALTLLAGTMPLRKGVRLLGVTLSNLEGSRTGKAHQLELPLVRG